MASARHICVVGDVHGHLQLALLIAARWQQELGVEFEAVFLAGDVGTFASLDDLDKATRRHAPDNPCELEFPLQWMAQPPAPHLARLFAPLEQRGCGLTCPVVMVTGNHEGFAHLEPLLTSPIPAEPVAIDTLPTVDRGGWIRLLPGGWRTVTPGGVTVAGLGGIQREQRRIQYHRLAYITDDQVLAITEGPPADLLVTHTGPAVTQPFPKGSDLLDVVADAGVARVWCHGHSVADDAIVQRRGTTIVPLHDAAFGRPHGPRDGVPGEDAWCHIAFDGDEVTVDRCRPAFWHDFHRRSWVALDDGQLVAPQLV